MECFLPKMKLCVKCWYPAAVTTVTWGQMRTFLAVVDLGSIRAAAGSLYVTEPAVSAAVTQLERHLGADLLARAGRGVRPTSEGLVYAGYCRQVLGLLEEAQTAVRAADRGRLRIGAVATASEYVLPPLLASFRQRFPEVEFTLSVLPRDELFARLGHHEDDLVLAGRPAPGSEFVSRASRSNTLIVVAKPGLVADPLSTTWLLRDAGSGTREATLGLLAQLDASPPVLNLGTLGAVVAAAREGLGVTLVHADAVTADLEPGLLVQLPVPHTPLDRAWHVSTTETPTPTARLFLDHITSPADVGEAVFHRRDQPAR